jgi:hypothetical protein
MTRTTNILKHQVSILNFKSFNFDLLRRFGDSDDVVGCRCGDRFNEGGCIYCNAREGVDISSDSDSDSDDD